MKRTRKGFTLIELLIVVAIMATLTAAMTVSVSGSTAKAKAATIASNVDAFVRAAATYCADNTDGDISSAKTDDVIGAYIGKWLDLKNGSSVKYEAVDLTKLTTGSKWTQDKTWCVKVTISDSDKTNIIAALEKIPGFGKYKDGTTSVVSTGTFHVRLWNGEVTTAQPADES